MITAIILTTMLNVGEISTLPPDKPKIERKRRGKNNRGRRKGGSGLR